MSYGIGGDRDEMRMICICWMLACAGGVSILFVLNTFVYALRYNLLKFIEKQHTYQPTQPKPAAAAAGSGGGGTGPLPTPPLSPTAASAVPVVGRITPAFGAQSATAASDNEQTPVLTAVRVQVSPPLPAQPVASGGGGGGGGLAFDTAYIRTAICRLIVPTTIATVGTMIAMVRSIITYGPGVMSPPDINEIRATDSRDVFSVVDGIYFAMPLVFVYAAWPVRNQTTDALKMANANTTTGTGTGTANPNLKIVAAAATPATATATTAATTAVGHGTTVIHVRRPPSLRPAAR